VIFLLVISYSILIVIFLAFIVFAMKVKNTMLEINNQLNEVKQDVASTRELFRQQIGDLLAGVKKVIEKK